MGKRITVLLSFLVLLALNPFSKVQAQNKVGYSVQAELPENQIDNSLSYFDIRISPGQEQELNILVYNHENEDITIRGDIYNASTNSNGLLVYEEQEETDPSLQNPVSELVTFENNEWTIPAGETITVSAQVNIPDESFNGIKLGGFYFEKIPDEQETAGGVSIQNRYAYLVGLQLSQNNEEVAPNLNLLSVEPQLVNYRTSVVAQVQNDQPVLMNDVTIQGQVYDGNNTEPIREVEQTDIQMAPNSTMDFVIDWENQPLEAGNYRLEMAATDTENTWEWTEEFTIAGEEENLNEEAVEIEEPQTNSTWYIIGIIVLAIIIVGLIFYIRKLKKEN